MKKIAIIKLIDSKNIKSKRNYGIDLLRIFSMINVIILHINLCSNQLKLKFNDDKFKPIWRLETLSYFAVNCFGLISGIVGYKKYKFSNLIYIWFNTSFYSFAFSLYLYFIKKNNFRNLMISLLPLLIKYHWYINAYFILYLFIPFINFGIMNINQKVYRNIILFYILFFSFYYVIGAILKVSLNFNYLNSGYSAQWLIILYIIGGYFGKYIIIKKGKLKAKIFIICLLVYLFSTFLSSELYFFLIEHKSQIKGKSFLINYISPTILLQALSLIIMFSKFSINNNFLIKIISFFTPLTLNITFIHFKFFRLKIITFEWMKNVNKNIICILIYQLGIALYIFCGLIDYLRSVLFRLLKIKRFCLFIEDKFPKLIEKILSKIYIK